MDLDSAPVEEHFPRSGKPYFAVLLSGFLTSVVTLAGVFVLGRNTDGFHIMGWYAGYVIPAGAVLVGIAAASGYAVASWLTGTRISRGLLLAVVFLQTGAYITAEYIEYLVVMKDWRQRGLMAGPEPSFPQYYDIKARSFAWKKQRPLDPPGKPLGGWGYVFVLLGAAGFILSGLIAPAMLFTVPYCEPCQRYMTTRLIGVLPASVPIKRITWKNQEAHAREHARENEEAIAKTNERLARLWAALAEGRTDSFKQELIEAGSIKANAKLPRRVCVSLVWCKGCQNGQIIAVLVNGYAEARQEVLLSQYPLSATRLCEMRE